MGCGNQDKVMPDLRVVVGVCLLIGMLPDTLSAFGRADCTIPGVRKQNVVFQGMQMLQPESERAWSTSTQVNRPLVGRPPLFARRDRR